MSGETLPATGPTESPERRAEQRAWYWYDWANSAYYTSVVTVLFAPYLIAVAEDAASRSATPDRVSLLGIMVAPGALPAYLITVTTVLSAVLLPLLGPIVDRVVRKRLLLGGLAWVGAAFGSLLWFAQDGNWQIGAVALVGANLAFAGSVVVQDSILPLISAPDRRDAVSSQGWAFGYLGGGLMLAINLVVVTAHDALGMTEGLAVRVSMLSAVVWWAGFTIIPVLKLRDHPLREPSTSRPSGGLVAASFGQLAGTLRELPRYPMALTFLLAYLFFNDGIQTVIASASTYGSEELEFGQSVLIATILLVQFVAFAGALLFGRLAAAIGAKHAILAGLAVWAAIVTAALVLPAGSIVPFLVLAVAIGIVLGGCQALARSYFSVLVPVGKEAEYFAFYHAADRGTSWLGTLTFGVVFQLTGSYRPAMFALIFFFGLGALLLSRVDTERGMRDAVRGASGGPAGADQSHSS